MQKSESILNKGIAPESPDLEYEFTLPSLRTALARDRDKTFTQQDWSALCNAEKAVLKENHDEIKEAVQSKDFAKLKKAEQAMLQQLTEEQKTKLRYLLCPPKIKDSPSFFQIMRHLFLAMLPIGLGFIIGIGLNKTKLFSSSVTLLVSISVSLITQNLLVFFGSIYEKFQQNIDRQMMFTQFKTQQNATLNRFKTEQNDVLNHLSAFQAQQNTLFNELKNESESKIEAITEFITEELLSLKARYNMAQFDFQNSSSSKINPSSTLPIKHASFS